MTFVARWTCAFALIALAAAPAMAQGDHDEEAPLAEAAAESAEDVAEHVEHETHGHHDLGHGNAGSMQGQMYEFRTDLAIYTLVVFGVLLLILGAGAWPKISAALLEREKRIEADLAAAADKHEEAKRLLAEHEAKLASSADEVREMLEEARRDAEATKAQIVEEARAAAEQERNRAIRDIELAKDQALKTLAERSANQAIDLAGKVIGQAIPPERHEALIREGLAQLGRSPAN